MSVVKENAAVLRDDGGIVRRKRPERYADGIGRFAFETPQSVYAEHNHQTGLTTVPELSISARHLFVDGRQLLPSQSVVVPEVIAVEHHIERPTSVALYTGIVTEDRD